MLFKKRSLEREGEIEKRERSKRAKLYRERTNQTLAKSDCERAKCRIPGVQISLRIRAFKRGFAVKSPVLYYKIIDR